MSDLVRSTDFCYNCGIRLTGRFCAACGQKVQDLNPSLKHFLHDLTHELLHVDGKIFQSVATLLTRPGVLTKDYFDGRRARWISPIRLYLVFSVIYFAVITLGDDGIRERTVNAVAYAMVVMLPLFAWLVALVARVRRNFPQHLYFALHVHAAWFGAFASMEAARTVLSRWVDNTRPVGLVATTYVVLYVILAFRRAYGESVMKSILKMSFATSVYLAIAFVVVVAAAMLRR
jgi:hypothetical protein